MKTRIVDTLIGLSQPETPEKYRSMQQELVDRTGLTTQQMQQKAAEILKSIVHNFAAFDVSTIDAFTNRIIRTFAKDMGLATNFELELDVKSILSEAVDRLIAKAGEDEELTKTMIDFAIAKSNEDKSWDITYDLNNIAPLIGNENNYAPLQKLKGKSIADFKNFKNEIVQKRLSLESELQAIHTSFFKLLADKHLEEKDFFKSLVPKFFAKLKQIDYKKDMFTGAWQNELADKALYPSRVSDDKKEVMDALQPQIVALFSRVKALFTEADWLKKIATVLPQFSLLQQIQEEVESIKKERNLLLISDFNNKISESIKGQPAPFIYERLGERYRHYFIDEAQDTSRFQWQNLVPLLGEAMAGIDENGQQGTLTYVGDAKQAIYQWRGGDPAQFIGLAQIPGDNPFAAEKSIQHLPKNYRSYAEVVRFNNSFFTFISRFLKVDAYRKLYENASQDQVKPEGGYVNISFVEGKVKAETDLAYCERVLEIITDLTDKNHPKKDICLLVRTNKQGVVIADFLNEQGIPVLTSESLLVMNSPKVQFMTQLLALVLHPEDLEQKVEVLRFLHEFADLQVDKHQFLADGLHGELPLSDYLRTYGIGYEEEKIREMSLYNAVEYIVRSFQLVVTSDAYVQFFLDFVLAFTQTKNGGLTQFLDFWEQKKEKLSIVTSEGEDAIRVMSIHKSKGLEFPIVIYPFADDNLESTRMDTVWVASSSPLDKIPTINVSVSKKFMNYEGNAQRAYEELMEQKELDGFNVLYVACTRAEKQLYLISTLPKGKEERRTLPTFFKAYLQKAGKWNDGTFNYAFGECLSKIKDEVAEENVIHENVFISSASSEHAIDIHTKSGSLWGSVQEEAIQQGNILHQIVSDVHSEDEVDSALQKALLKGIISSEEENKYRELIEEIIHHEALRDFFTKSWQVYNEREIIAQGEVLRPDRININEKGKVVIIDYKTGEMRPEHANQVVKYANAIEEMGYSVKKKLLVYTHAGVKVKNV